MACITIRDLPDKTKERLRIHAAQAGVSLEAYARLLLEQASRSKGNQPVHVLEIADKYFGAEGGVEIGQPNRFSKRQPADFK